MIQMRPSDSMSRNEGDSMIDRRGFGRITPEHDMTWTTVSFRPGIDVKAGESLGTMMSPCGRVILAVLPDRAEIYRRNTDGDYELVTEIDLL